MRRSQGGDLVEVELVEDDLDVPVREPAGWLPERWVVWLAGRGGRGSLLVRAASCVAVVGLTVAVAQGGAAAADSARLAAVPGLAASLDAPLHEAWTADVRAVLGVAGDRIFTQDGGTGLVALRESDGEVLWKADTRGGFCALQTGDPELDGWQFIGRPAPATADVSVVCQGTVATLADDGAAGATSTQVDVYDAATGAVTASATLVGGDQSVMITGPDVVVVGTDAEHRVAVTRWSWREGRTLWEYRSAAPVTALASDEGPALRMSPDLLEFASEPPLAIDLSTGTEVDPESPGIANEWHLQGPELADGATVSTVVADGGARYEVVEADGSVRFGGDGYVFPLVVHDPADGVFVVLDNATSGLIGVDARTGAERWRLGSSTGMPVAVVDGTLLVSNGLALLAVDAQHGTELWRRVGQVTEYTGNPVTDGRSWLALETTAEGPWLVALGVRDGSERWRVAAPEGALALAGVSPDGTVLVQTTSSIVALRP
ncbi:MAG: PQQ-binding-like beta-propeller repeat protein [Cellulomonadaceae bacterium]|nr:PQQ-binding-like beta-propeller repeat protein [Cellulomonadaceae bacterium]